MSSSWNVLPSPAVAAGPAATAVLHAAGPAGLPAVPVPSPQVRCCFVLCSPVCCANEHTANPFVSAPPFCTQHNQAVWDVHPCVCRPHGKVRWVVWLLSVCLRACANVPTTTTKKYSTCAYEGGCWVDVTQPWLAPQRLYWGNEVLNASMSAAGMPCARSGTAGGSSSIPPVS